MPQRFDSARNRPVLFELPHVRPHVKNLDGLVGWKVKLIAAEMVAKPFDIRSLAVTIGGGSKIQISKFLTWAVSPRADGQPGAEMLRAHIAVESAHQENVEPAPLRVSNRLDVREALFDRHVSPIVIIHRMCQPVSVELNNCIATAEVTGLQGQVPQDRVVCKFVADVWTCGTTSDQFSIRK